MADRLHLTYVLLGCLLVTGTTLVVGARYWQRAQQAEACATCMRKIPRYCERDPCCWVCGRCENG